MDSNIIVYSNGEIELKISIENETIWLTQKQISELFEKDVRTINEHIKKIYKDEELYEDSTIRKFRIVQKEGNRTVTREVKHYNLDVIKSAKTSIILIDNYVDDLVLTLFSKIPQIKVTIYTHTISKQLKQDYEKYQKQYNNVTLKIFKNSHDRFLIIDNKEVYHIGASLKDLGKKWFAFQKRIKRV